MQSNKASQAFVNEDTVECDVRFGAKRKVLTEKVLTRKFLLLESPESLHNCKHEKTCCAVNSTVPNALLQRNYQNEALLLSDFLVQSVVLIVALQSYVTLKLVKNRSLA